MKYTVSHACGHEQTHDIYGPNTKGQRQRTADRYAQQDCADCRTQSREAAHTQAVTQAIQSAEATMPELTGTPKQVTWAETLRERTLAQLADNPDAVRVAAHQTGAEWWIDHRDDLAGNLISMAQKPESTEQDTVSSDETNGGDPWELLERRRDVYDAAPQIRTTQQAAVAHMLLVALRRCIEPLNDIDRSATVHAELVGEVKALRRVLTEQLRVCIGMPLNDPLGVPEGTDWHTLTAEQRDKSEYLWLRRELDRYREYADQQNPVGRLQRAWMDWNLATIEADDALDRLATVASQVNDSDAPERLSFQQIADAIPADRGRSWAQWLVTRGRKSRAGQ